MTLRSTLSAPLLAALVTLTPGLLATPAAASVLYVDAALTTGANDGSSWADAFQGELGLVSALTIAVPGEEVWVAAGTYVPAITGDLAASFPLPSAVSVYGSFAGGETSPAQRPPFGTADSILSGDQFGDDGLGQTDENSCHVLVADSGDDTAVLDGFVVSGGLARVDCSAYDSGAGLICTDGSSPTLRHCRFVGLSAVAGGAVAVLDFSAPRFVDCTFEGNSAFSGGAATLNDSGATRFERCLFQGNSAARGGALECFFSVGVLVDNCILRDNLGSGTLSGFGAGAAWVGIDSEVAFRNCTLVGNRSEGADAGGLHTDAFAVGVSAFNCIFWGNEGPGGATGADHQVNALTSVGWSVVEGGFSAGGAGLVDADPLFVDGAAGDFRLEGLSPAIDAGNNAKLPIGFTTDFAGEPRLFDAPAVVDTGFGPAPLVDMGAHEFTSPWTDLGHGLAGTGGVTPVLTGSGPLVTGTFAHFNLSHALPGAQAWAVVGFSQWSLPFKGGVMVPAVDLLLGPLPVDASGELPSSMPWPSLVPSGSFIYWQEWVQDPAGPVGFAASNALLSVNP